MSMDVHCLDFVDARQFHEFLSPVFQGGQRERNGTFRMLLRYNNPGENFYKLFITAQCEQCNDFVAFVEILFFKYANLK